MKTSLWSYFLLVACLVPSLEAYAIGGGKVVAPGQFEARSALLVYWMRPTHPSGGRRSKGPRQSQCSGVLVAPDIVMTAAHCLVNQVLVRDGNGVEVAIPQGESAKPGEMFVYLGNADLTKPPEASRQWLVVEVRIYPNYMKSDGYGHYETRDIALLKLAKAAPAPYAPVKPLLDAKALTADQEITLAGFGDIYGSGDSREPKSRTLRSFDTLILRPMDLNTPKIGQIQLYRPGDLPRFRQKSAHRTQAQKRAIDLLGELGGDSGGPAFIMIQGEHYVAGIASGYDDLGYATYENVPNDADWITATMDELEATSIATK